jgi:aquaporin Z
MSTLARKALAEAFGTCWLVIGGCGTAVLAGGTVSWVGVSIAFGLTVVTMAYAIGHISGCHLNPAVSVGVWSAGRMSSRELGVYVVAQVIGGILGAGVVLFIAKGAPGGYSASVSGLAANGYEAHSPGKYSLIAALVTEVIMTFVFLMVILGSTARGAPAGFAGLAIGLGLTLIHLISIPVTNTSVNPARSTGPALFVGGWALEQLWLFWVAPIAGAFLAGIGHKILEGRREVVPGSPAKSV